MGRKGTKAFRGSTHIPRLKNVSERAYATGNGVGPYTFLTLCRLARGITVVDGWRTFSR